jgi:glutamate carboxypeptidase
VTGYARVVLLAIALAVVPASAAGQLAPPEERMAAWIDAHAEEAIGLIARVVDINSGTMNHDGVRRIGDVFRAEFDALGFTTRWVEMPDSIDRAGHLFAEREGRPGSRRFLLIGHIDTVFEPDHPFQRFVRAGHRATGPGAVDMKSGDVAIVYALKALAAENLLDDASFTVALIGDEESAGLPLAVTRAELVEAGQRADAALGFESGDPGLAVVARRGSSDWTLRVKGRENHSSAIFREGVGSGAIYETARILWRFYDEVRVQRTLTFNPGIVVGGTEITFDDADKRGTAFGKNNVVAQIALVDGDLRFLTAAEKEAARGQMRAIVAENLPGTSAEITFEDKYPAMPPTEGNERLLERYADVSEDLGFGGVEPYDPASRGAADISFVAPYVDGIDGLGPSGEGAHSPDETLDLPSVAAATKRAAIFIHRLAQDQVARSE